jgi:hypothetical protein
MMKNSIRQLVPASLGLVAISLLTTSVGNAAVSTWNGGASPDGFMGTAGNWDTPPASGAGNTLNFAGSLNLNATNNITLTSADQTINFNSGASAFTLWGSAVRAGGIANNSSVLQTINTQLRLNGGRTFNVGTAGIQLNQPVGSTSTSGRSVTKSGSGDLTIGGGTAMSGGSGYSVSAGRLVFNGSSATSLGTGGNGISLTASGTSLVFNNSGTLTMVGAIGTVSGSSVVLNNAGAVTATGGSTIASGASLSGVGSLIGGTVSVSGDVAPGTSGIGTISVASLTLATGSSSTMEINRSAGQTADLISATGTVSFDGTLNVNNIGAALQSGDSFNLFDAGSFSGFFASTNLPSLGTGLGWDVTHLGDQGLISVITIPEPTVISLAGLAGLIALATYRRKQ